MADRSSGEIEAVRGLIPSDPQAAARRARALVAAEPEDGDRSRLLRDAVIAARDSATVELAHAPLPPPHLAEARAKLAAGEDEFAEILVRERLKRAPDDVEAMDLMAEIAARCGFLDNAVLILRRAADLAPGRAASWAHLGRLLHRQGKVEQAVGAMDEALRLAPGDEANLSYAAAMLVRNRRLDEGLVLFERLVEAHPHAARGWMNYAFALKTVGRTAEAIAAYRSSLALDPSSGPAWWGLANLKVGRFLPEDLDAMALALAGTDIGEHDRCDLHFALARALDQFSRRADSARQLDLGNALRRNLHPYDPTIVSRDVDRSIAFFSRPFFAARRGWGSKRRDPVFILGMPRSGSTLVEQILASHSQVEGTEELFIVQRIAEDRAGAVGRGEAWTDCLGELPPEAFERLAERYLSESQGYRRSDRPFFTDKMPGNWPYVGLIHLMLPGARIVDVRRDPRDCCFANYAQHFQWGMNAMYGQSDIACYYRDYVRLMRHFDAVLPGRIHRIVYEDLVEDAEGQVRGLLDYLDLPFEPACLRFFETERAVHSPSAQQVRRPINRDGIGRWRSYEPYLQPMLAALGDLPQSYRR